MTRDPWTDPDPQPGDFDDYLQSLDPSEIRVVEADASRHVSVVVSLGSEDGERLTRISARRGETPSELLSSLLRDADRSAA